MGNLVGNLQGKGGGNLRLPRAGNPRLPLTDGGTQDPPISASLHDSAFILSGITLTSKMR